MTLRGPATAPEQNEPQRKAATAVAAALVVGVAVALRFWRIDWGLAANSPFPDEVAFFTSYTARFVPLSWSSFDLTSFTYPTLYGNLAGLATAIAHALGWIVEEPKPTSPATILVARVVSALLGVGTVGVVYQAARRMYSRAIGYGAAALMAVAPLHAMQTHIASTDVALTTASALVLLASYALAQRGTVRLALAAGLAGGLAFGAKYTGLAMIVPVGWAALEAGITARSTLRALSLGFTALAAFALSFAVACPPCAWHPERLLEAMQTEQVYKSALARGFANNFLAPSLGWYGRPYLYQLCASLPYALGWPLYALAVAGVVSAVMRRQLADRIALAAIVPYFAFMGAQRVVFPRYLLPLFPALVVLAARALLAGGRWPRLRTGLFAALLLYSGTLAATQVARFSRGQQAAVAQWIARRSHPVDLMLRKVRVAVPDFPLDYFGLHGPLARARLVEVRVSDGHWFDQAVDAFILPEWYAIAIRRDSPKGPAAEQLRQLESGQLGYRLAARWSSSYLQRDLYTRLDAAFAADLWQGEIGFSVFERAAERESPR